MPSWRRVFTSDEARIEGLAGASPPDRMSDYDRSVNPNGELCAACGRPARGYAFIDDARYCHPDEGPSCYVAGQGTGLTAADAVELGLAGRLPGWIVEHRGDWPFSGDAPTTPPDDEALVVPELSIAERAERLRRMGATPAMLAWYTQTRPQDLAADDEDKEAPSC